MNKSYTSIAMVLVCFSMCLPGQVAFGHGGGGDIALYSDAGQVGVGFATLDENDINQTFFDPNDIVHQSIMIPQPAIPPFFQAGSTEPGFDANETELTPNAAVTVNPVSLMYWDGTGPVNFVASSIPFGYSPIADTDSQGGFHDHPVFGLGDMNTAVADGVYVAEMTVNVAGMQESDPYYLVTMVDALIMNDANPEDSAELLGELIRDYQEDPANGAPMFGGKDFTFYADAVAHVEATVPEPASASLMAIAMGLLALRGRRS